VNLATPLELVRRVRTRITHRVASLPVLVLMPHGGCDCRCLMCDIWRRNPERRQLEPADIAPHLEALRRLGVRRVVLSGGEALLHERFSELCGALRGAGVELTLLSSGLGLGPHAERIAAHCRDVIVSLDGPPPVHDAIRRVPRAWDRLAQGVAALRRARPGFRVSARCTVQRANYLHLPETVAAAREIGLDGISFLAVDVTSSAFNRPEPWDAGRAGAVGLAAADAAPLEREVERLIAERAADLATGFVAESPARLRRLAAQLVARPGEAPAVSRCDAPWVSAVVEADGAVRPCFFHPPIGRLGDGPLDRVLNSERAVAFRRGLDVATDPVCRGCVCSLRLPLHRSAPR
jgi:MoaA/NifB/PqqE/SkfB family radical SAM enzyme